MKRALLTAAFIAAVLLANILTDRFGFVWVAPGLETTAGTYAAGAALLIRDALQRTAGRPWVIGAILAGGVLTWALASPMLALASVTAFLASELIDTLIFTRVQRRHGFDRAALTSNLVSAPVDTIVFLWIAPFPITFLAVIGQMIGKLVWATLLPLGVKRALSRQSD